jgi:hypothetical protein
MRLLFSVGYFGSWFIAAALLSFVSIALLWETANVSYLIGFDDDITMLALPMGGVLGVWAAVRSRHAPVVHRVSCILSMFLTPVGVVMAYWFMQRSHQAKGSGPFAGLGELIGVALSIGIAAVGACMFGIWAFAKLARVADVDEHRIEPTKASDA